MQTCARVLVYAPPSVHCMAFADAIRQVETVGVLELFRTTSDIRKAVVHADYFSDYLVLMPKGAGDLRELTAIADDLSRIRIIIVLPRQCKIMIELGHRLHPRFLTFISGAKEEVQAVIEKMTHRESIAK